MPATVSCPYLQLMRNRIDPIHVPFSDRGSRLLLYRYPDHAAFYLKLAERLEQLQPGLETHRARTPFLTDIALLDGEGQRLDFDQETFPHVIHCHTPIGRFSITYYDYDTLAVGLPPGVPAGISLIVSDLFQSSRALPGDLINSRRVELQSNLITRLHRQESDKAGLHNALIVEAGEQGAIHISLVRGLRALDEVPRFLATLSAAHSRWDEWFKKVPAVPHSLSGAYAYAWWSLANNLVAPLGQVRYEAMMPSKAQYFGIWNWDACFHAVGLMHLDPELARNQLRTLLAAQCEDGMIPDVVHDEGIVDHIDHPIAARVTKPPVMAWAALKIHAIDPNFDFLREIFPALKRWNGWWMSQRTGEIEGLAHYQHPYSSGLDDSPLWEHCFPVVAPDLNTYLVIQMEALAVIAEALGLSDEAHTWRAKSEQLLSRMLEALYDPELGFFWPRHSGQPILERTPMNLYPLWSGRIPREVEARLVEHLNDPGLFWGPYPLSTVARTSDAYAPTTMWRGPVWININYIFIEALQRVGQRALAEELRERTLALVARNEGIYEYYNPEEGTPPERAAPMFGWSAALFIDLCLQQSSS